MDSYDVIVVGGGPAGGECARELSKKGHSVLMVEQSKSFKDNNFSSAGMTLDPLDKFNIPETTVGSYWKNMVIQCSKKGYKWKGDKAKGVVLDFGRLRQFLADDCITNNGGVLMGHKYFKKEVEKDCVVAFFKNLETLETVKIKAKLLVDATGPLRKVIYDDKNEIPEFEVASGIEYLIEVEQDIYNKCKESLIFFLGDKWAPSGYSWIFPMENNILKVGSGKLHEQNVNMKNQALTKEMILKIIDDYLEADTYKVIDIHGGTLKYSQGLKDVFYQNKVVAIGDAVSTVNPLGGEGIQYAMENGALAAKYISQYLTSGKENFKKYRSKWRRKYFFKWYLCEASTRRMYNKYDDEKIEKRVQYYHQNANIDGLINVLFNFNFNKIIYRLISSIFYKYLFEIFKKEK